MRKRTLKWILIFFFGSVVLYAAYELHLKFVINDFQVSLIEKRLVKNYDENYRELSELTNFFKQFRNLELVISSQDKLELIIDNIDSAKYEDTFYILIEGDSINLYDVTLEPKDIAQVISKSSFFDTLEVPNWTVDYSGNINSEMASLLLNNRGIGEQDLQIIQEKLQLVNCIGILKTDNRIEIRFKGHRFNGFNYVFPLNSTDTNNLNHLTGNFYWEHFESELFCGWTNWGWI